MQIAQEQRYTGEDWWNWSVWLDASPGEIDEVEKVVWRLHPTFRQPIREHTNREENFRLDTAGWGTFRIRADVHMKDGRTSKLFHDLELYYDDDKPAPR